MGGFCLLHGTDRCRLVLHSCFHRCLYSQILYSIYFIVVNSRRFTIFCCYLYKGPVTGFRSIGSCQFLLLLFFSILAVLFVLYVRYFYFCFYFSCFFVFSGLPAINLFFISPVFGFFWLCFFIFCFPCFCFFCFVILGCFLLGSYLTSQNILFLSDRYFQSCST